MIFEGYNVERLSRQDLRKLAAGLTAQLQEYLPDIRIIELVFTCEHACYVVVQAALEHKQEVQRLLQRIANVLDLVSQLPNSSWPPWVELPAKRKMDLKTLRGVVDSTAYDTLRLGLMTWSDDKTTFFKLMQLRDEYLDEQSTTGSCVLEDLLIARLKTTRLCGNTEMEMRIQITPTNRSCTFHRGRPMILYGPNHLRKTS